MTSDLARAAEILEEEADLLHETHTVDGRWPDNDDWDVEAHRRHDEYKALANRLRKAVF